MQVKEIEKVLVEMECKQRERLIPLAAELAKKNSDEESSGYDEAVLQMLEASKNINPIEVFTNSLELALLSYELGDSESLYSSFLGGTLIEFKGSELKDYRSTPSDEKQEFVQKLYNEKLTKMIETGRFLTLSDLTKPVGTTS